MPGLLRGFDDESAHLAIEGVTVDLEDASVGLDDVEGERLEYEVGPKPHVLALAALERRPEDVAAFLPDLAVLAVGGDHEVVVRRELVGWRSLGEEVDLRPKLDAAFL